MQEVILELLRFIQAPLLSPTMIWTIAPLIVVTLAMTYYFGKYPSEQLGWNTVLGNSIVLLFVSLDLLRTIHSYTTPASFENVLLNPVKVGLIFLLLLEGILLAYAAFKHAKLQKIVYFFASAQSINTQAYLLTVIVYLQLQPTLHTVLAAFIFFMTTLITLRILQEIEHFSFGNHGKK